MLFSKILLKDKIKKHEEFYEIHRKHLKHLKDNCGYSDDQLLEEKNKMEEVEGLLKEQLKPVIKAGYILDVLFYATIAQVFFIIFNLDTASLVTKFVALIATIYGVFINSIRYRFLYIIPLILISLSVIFDFL